MALGNINDIAAFVAVVRAGSFTDAAKQLGITRSAVGKIVARLEERLAVRLIHRTPRSFSLSDDGEAFYARCAQILEDLEEAELAMAVRSGTPSGTLRLSVPIALGHLHVLPVVEDFLAQWPGVTVELSFTDRFIDLVDEGFDVAVRIGEIPADSRFIARPLATQRLMTCAAPSYLAERGTPTTPESLDHHRLMHFMTAGKMQPWLIGETNSRMRSADTRLRMDSAEALIEAAVRGLGIIHMPTYLLAQQVRDGRLTPLLTGYTGVQAPISALYPSRRHLTPKVRLFVETLIAAWRPVPPWERDLPTPPDSVAQAGG